MKTTTKKLSDTKVEITATIGAEELKTARTAAIKQLAENLKVQGFRKGKVPFAVAEKHLAPNEISEQTIDLAVRTSMPAAFADAKCEPLAIENVSVTKYVPDESAEYVVKAEILPEVKIGDYQKLTAALEPTEASAADVQEIVDNIINAYAEKKVAKKAAENGDEVIIDFVGKKDGEAFAGGTAKDHHLVLGSGQFIPGFEDGIVGHSAGDKFDLKLTFPKDYPEKSLAGEKVVFETLVKQVNEVVKPKEDDELAKKCGNFKNMDELRADIKKNLELQNEHRAMDKFRDDLVKELVSKSKVEAPEILIGDQMRFIHDDMVRNAASRGMTFEQYLERAGETPESWDKQARELAAERVKASLVLQILAREQKVEVSDEEVNAKVAELQDVYKNSKEALANLKKPEVRQDVKNRMIIDKTMELLVAANRDNKPAKKAGKKADKADKAEKSDKAEKKAKK